MITNDERGETLVEILMTIVILGIAVAGLIATMTSTVTGTDSHRRLADSEVLTRAYGETIKNNFLHPATTTLQAGNDVVAHDTNTSGFIVTLKVASASGFPTLATPTWYVTVDTEVMQITAVAGTTWTAKAFGSGSHASGPAGAKVRRYYPCPTTSDVTPTFTYPSGVSTSKFTGPTVTAVDYFSHGNPAAQVSAGSCAAYWDTEPAFCNELADAHFAGCDPPLIRITFAVSSTDLAASGRAVSTSSAVLIRRSNA